METLEETSLRKIAKNYQLESFQMHEIAQVYLDEERKCVCEQHRNGSRGKESNIGFLNRGAAKRAYKKACEKVVAINKANRYFNSSEFHSRMVRENITLLSKLGIPF